MNRLSIRSYILGIAVLSPINLSARAAEVYPCGRISAGIPHFQDFTRHPLTQLKPPGVPQGVDGSALPADVTLRLIVNRNGEVASACIVRKSKSVFSPSRSILEEAAVSALLKWKYPPDFGLQGNLRLNFKQVWGEVIIRFEPPSAKPTGAGGPSLAVEIWDINTMRGSPV